MFLHIDNKENPLTLADAFIMPDYKRHQSVKRIDFSYEDMLDEIIDKFMTYDRTSTMLITGVPGIGKSSITSWIAHKYENDDNVIILRFRDWEYEELNSGLLKAIYHTLDCGKGDLENKILVLDGYDEIKALDKRDRLLGAFISKLKDFGNLKCIITSRPAYVNSRYFNNAVELKEFDIERVEKFYKTITGAELIESDKIKNNLEVLGIPVILYMAVMSDINISENPTKPELYNRIFAETGGIFDRFSCEGIGYSSGEQVCADPENTKIYLRFLRKVAFGMFEKRRLTLKTGEYKVPELESENGSVSILEFPIKHLFENTDADIEFIHKSIYEYFVSEHIFEALKNELEKQCIIEDIAGILGKLLRYQELSREVIEFLKYRIKNSSLNKSFDKVNNAFQLMLKDGMTYYVEDRCKSIFKCEVQIFKNMLEVLHCWENRISCSEELIYYILNINCNFINLAGADLAGAILTGADLTGADLTGAILRGAYLEGAYLRGADLTGADLRGADLRGADLRVAYLNLRGADLTGADLRGADLTGADLTGADFDSAMITGTLFDELQIDDIEKCFETYKLIEVRINVYSTKEILPYKDYCNRYRC